MRDRPPRLLDHLREKIRLKPYSIRTEEAYAEWVRRFVVFHGRRHPPEMSAAEVEVFFTHRAVTAKAAASNQNQVKSALLLLYKEVLGAELSWLEGVASAKTRCSCRLHRSHRLRAASRQGASTETLARRDHARHRHALATATRTGRSRQRRLQPTPNKR